jgi:NTE family protein
VNYRESDESEPSDSRSPLGLALTGGGFRAAFFHVGVLAQLARYGLLRQVHVLSTVSGGSIVGALYYLHLKNLLESEADADITDDHYVEIVKAVEEQLLSGVSSNFAARSLLGIRRNLSMVGPRYSRTDRLGELYDEVFFRPAWDAPLFDAPAAPRRYPGPVQMRELMVHPVGEEPDFHPLRDNARRRASVPVLIVNATTLNTGHIWRFEASRMGEPPRAEDAPDRPYMAAQVPDKLVEDLDRNMRLRPPRSYDELPNQHRATPLGAAVAASAAVPGLTPPLALLELYPGIDVQLVDGSLAEPHGIQGLCDYGCGRFVVSSGNRGAFDIDRPSTAAADVRMRSSTINLERLRSSELSRLRRGEEAAPATIIHLRKGLPTTAVPWIGREGVADVPVRERTTSPTCEAFGVVPSVQEALSRIRNAFGSFTEIEAMSLMLDGYRMGGHELRPLSDVPRPPTTEWDFERLRPLMSRPTQEYLRQLRLGSHRRTGKLELRPGLRWFLGPLLVAATAAVTVALVRFVPPWAVVIAMLVVALAVLLTTRPARTPGVRVAMKPLRGALQFIGALAAPAGAVLLLLFDRMVLPAGRVERLEQRRGVDRLPRGVRALSRMEPRIVSFLLTVLGFAAGSVPLALVVGDTPLIGYLAAEAVVVGALSLRRLSPKAPSAPMRAEVALAWGAALFPAAVLSLISLAVYGGLRLFIVLVGGAGRAFGGDFHPDTRPHWVLVSTIGFSLLLGLAFAMQTARGIAGKLYPETQGGRSLFYAAAATRGRMVGWGFVVGVAVFGGFVAGWILWREWWLAGLLEAFILLGTAMLWQRGAAGVERPDERIVAAVAELLKTAGFEVKRDPETGRASVDSVVRGVDLLAEGHQRRLAVEVKTGSSSTHVDWTAASSLRVAASALGSELRSRRGGPAQVEPVLFLVGVHPDESLEEFSRDIDVTLVRLPDEESLDLARDGSAASGYPEVARALGLSGRETNGH